VVVIIGILAAFELESISNENAEKRTVEMHFQQIIDETNFNKSNVKYAIKTGELNLKKCDSLLALLSEGKSSNLKTINRLSLELLELGVVYTRKNAYNSLIESGDIKLIQDFQLKNEIIKLYEYYKWVDGYEQISLDNYNKVFYPYLIDNLDLIDGSLQNEQIYFSKKFKNSVATYRYSMKNKLGKYHECLSVIEDFLEEKASANKDD
jgi:signal peptidase I